jgi:membrane-associated PAP2 superfamily phosphatase
MAVALLTTLLFANGSLDIALVRPFYASHASPWPYARLPPWSLLYRAAPWLTAGLVIAALAALGAGYSRTRPAWRRHAVLVLLAVAIGPGVIDNVLLKDHWQHPRPRELVEFGGSRHYVPAPLIGREGGASFPCGHCSVGFLYAAGWWIWRRRRPRWARASLLGGLALGVTLGAGRMAAGAHFFSDVIWSALLAFAVLHILDHHVLAPAALAEAGDQVLAITRWRRALVVAALTGAIAVLLALFAAPHGTLLNERVPLALAPGRCPPCVLEVVADRASIELVLVDAPEKQLIIEGELHGFGLPGAHLGAHAESLPPPEPGIRYRIETRGWITDADALVMLRVPASAFGRVSVRVRRGDIRVTDATSSGVVRSQHVQLRLHTDQGRIQSP